MQRIYFDESGQSGTHLLDLGQPNFGIGSTNVEEAEAAAIIAKVFPGQQGPELKSSSILRRSGGRSKFINLCKEIKDRQGGFCGAKINKRFTVIAKMVDHLVEPPLHLAGYNFYGEDYGRRYTNMVVFALDNFLEKAKTDHLLKTYNTFARRPDEASLTELQSELKELLASTSSPATTFLTLFEQGAQSFKQLHDLSNFTDSNEIHVTAIITCMGHWQNQSAGPFEVIHDESKHFFSRSALWEMMTNPNNPPTEISVGSKTLRLPIPVMSTTGAQSHLSSSLQLCDLVAGFITRMSADNLSAELRDFFEQAMAAGFDTVPIFPVEAGTDFVSGPPPLASGPDAVDQIARAVSGARR